MSQKGPVKGTRIAGSGRFYLIRAIGKKRVRPNVTVFLKPLKKKPRQGRPRRNQRGPSKMGVHSTEKQTADHVRRKKARKTGARFGPG